MFEPYICTWIYKSICSFFCVSRAGILVGRRSAPDREKCGHDRVICLEPDQWWNVLPKRAQVWACIMGARSGPDMAPSYFVFLQIVKFKRFSFSNIIFFLKYSLWKIEIPCLVMFNKYFFLIFNLSQENFKNIHGYPRYD